MCVNLCPIKRYFRFRSVLPFTLQLLGYLPLFLPCSCYDKRLTAVKIVLLALSDNDELMVNDELVLVLQPSTLKTKLALLK